MMYKVAFFRIFLFDNTLYFSRLIIILIQKVIDGLKLRLAIQRYH
jgi:hypothetical protein